MAESRIDVFIKLKDQITAGLKNIRKEFKGINKEADELDDTDTKNARKEFDLLEKEINDIKTATERTNAQLDTVRNAGLAIAGLGAALAAPFLLGIKATAEFSRQIAEIGTLVDDAVLSNDELRKTVKDLSNEFGTSRGEIAQGLYQAISSGAQAGAEANEVLRVALLTARGGVTSVSSAVDGLSTVMNAFGFATSEAEAVADRLFVTVKNGRTTIDELSRFLFQAAPVAAALGIPFEELNAALVTLTKQGVPTRVAFTQIRSAINGLVRDTPELNKIFAEFGGAQKALGELGLAGTLQLVRDAANGNVGVLNKLLGSIEGVGAALGLSGPQLEEFNRQLRDQKAALGDAQAAADEVAASFGEKLSQSIERVGNLFEELGNFITPVLGPLIEGIGNLAVGFQDLLETSAVTRFFTGFVAVSGALAIVLGGLITTFALLGRGLVLVGGSSSILNLKWRQLRITTLTLQTAVRGLGRAMRFMLGPVGLAITAVGLLIGSMSALADETERAEDTTERLIATFANLSTARQVEALRAQELNVVNLKLRLQELRAELAEKIKGGFFLGPDEDSVLETQAAITVIETDLEEAEEAAVDFRTALEEISDARVDPTKIKTYEKNVENATEAVEELKAALEEAKAAALEIPDAQLIPLTTSGGGFGAGGAAAGTALVNARRQAQTDAAKAAAAQAQTDAQNRVDDANTTLGIEKEILAIAVEQNRQLDLQSTADERAAEALKARLALAKAELTTAQAITRAIQARAQAASREQQAAGRLAAEQDQQALDSGDIDVGEFAQREADRIQAQVDVDLEGLEARLDAVRALGDAKVEDLKAKRAEDAAKVTLETIEAAEVAAAQAAEAIESEIKVRLLDAETDLLAVGAQLADAFIDGFESSFSRITTVLQAELIRLKALFDSDQISSQDFADGVAAANAVAAESFKVLRQALVDALAVASGAEAQALIALIAQIDSSVIALGSTLGAFEAQVIQAIEGSLADFFETIITDIDDVNEAFTKLLQSIGDKVKRLIAEKLANKLIESLFGSGSVLGSLFGSGGGSTGAAKGGYIMRAARGGYVQGKAAVRIYRLAQAVSAPVAASTGGSVSTVTNNVYTAAKGGGILKMAGGGRVRPDDDEELRKGVTAAGGGGILKMQTGGGKVRGPGTKLSDSIPAMLSAGEYVMRAAAVDKYGLQLMEALNRGIHPAPPRSNRVLSITRPRKTAFAGGGFVGSTPLESQAGAGSQGIQNAQKAANASMTLEVNEATLNLTMRDFLEREFGRIMATR